MNDKVDLNDLKASKITGVPEEKPYNDCKGKRPCCRNHSDPDPQNCFLCKLFLTNLEYNLKWGGDGKLSHGAGSAVKFKNGSFNFVDDEERTRRLYVCNGCEHFEKSIFLLNTGRCSKCGCAAQGLVCPLNKWETRHLHYFCYPPLHQNGWRWNVEQLAKRKDLFNGIRVVAVVLGRNCVPLASVKQAFTEALGPCKFVPVINSGQQESGPWLAQWELLKGAVGPHDYVFRAHAKGASKPEHYAAEILWAEMMYGAALDNWLYVYKLLRQYPILGSFKNLGGFLRGTWHYAGSFYWVRGQEGYACHRDFDFQWTGVEGWPGIAFDSDSGGDLFNYNDVVAPGVRGLYLEEVARAAHVEYLNWRKANGYPAP